MARKLILLCLTTALIMTAGSRASFAVEPHAGMLRYPDVSQNHIVFVYANDIWLAPIEGGTAVPLASPPGQEQFPRFSPDGKTVAFMGNYDGNTDLYTLPVTGGTPFRLTHHPAREFLSEWTPGGELIFYGNLMQANPFTNELFTLPAGGGLPEKLPVPYGACGAISDDGQWLAYVPTARDQRTWKRYRGGRASDIWLFHLSDYKSKKITEWEGTDSLPMWHGDNIYYLSDAGKHHRLNIWVYETATGKRRQVTHFKDYDAKWPAVGPDHIIFQYGSQLRLLDLKTEKSKQVQVTVPGARPKIRTRSVDASGFIFRRNISSTGKRVVVGARGDIWTLPAKKGSPVNLTRTSGVAERDPAWSPDGQWISYFSDTGDAYDLYIVQSDGLGEHRRLTRLEKGYLYLPAWSPDSAWIAFWDQAGTLLLHNVESGKTREVDSFNRRGLSRVNWSSDSNWITYARPKSTRELSSIWLYNIEKDEKHQVTRGMFNDSWPTFDREGKYLYFASNRQFTSPIFADIGFTWIYAKTDRLYAVPLRNDVESPLAPESDDEEWKKEKDEDAAEGDDGKKGKEKDAGDKKEKDEDKEADEGEDKDKKEGDKKKDEPEPVKIDLEGFERRAVQLPVPRGGFTFLNVNDGGKLIYVRLPDPGSEDEGSIHLLDLDDEKKKEKTVLAGVGTFAMSADGKKILAVKREGTMAIVDAKADQKMENMVSTAGMTVQIDPRKEWRQIFNEAWRIHRDFFYVPNMHGVDWKAVRRQYAAMLEDCASRADLSYVIGEMIAELNIGHAYYFGGDTEQAPTLSVGMPGCDFRLENGAYRIGRIFEGAPWDVDARGPLSQPGTDIKTGDYLLAVNGVPVDTARDPWAAFQGMGGRTVKLTVSEEPAPGEKDRQVLVKLPSDERNLRYRAWIERNRAYVAEKTDGRVGYIYVPDTSFSGHNDLMRQFCGQWNRDALIIDERWNRGGFVPTRMVELLNRPVANYWATRYAKEDRVVPADAHHGPKCMLINGFAGSGGDYFPFWFRENGLGKLIGTRTWGGLVGMSGNPGLIDGGYTSVPTIGFYEKDGTWGIEGHGVDPDIEVADDPARMVNGEDPQLDAAIEHMLQELKRRPYQPPDRPSPPDRSGMGIKPADK
jgi:tricorn protease